MEQGGAERRKFPRRPISIQVKYKSLDTFFYDYAINVSHGGIFIKTRKPLPRGSGIEIEFEIPDAPRSFMTSGKVVRVIASGEDEMEPAGMGIEFDPLTTEDKDMIDLLWRRSAKEKERPG